MTIIGTGRDYDIRVVKKRQIVTLILDANLLKGTFSGKDENLSISASISGSGLDGYVLYLGMFGDLQRRVPEDTIQDAFSGKDGADVFAVGFWREAIS